MVSCMIADLECLRLFIRQTWEKYRNHKISLINASTSTNVALHFARGIEQPFMTPFPQFFNWLEIVTTVFSVFIKRHRSRHRSSLFSLSLAFRSF